MIRNTFGRRAVAAAFCPALVLLGAGAVAQPSFAPPLDAATPLAAPAEFRLLPGTGVDCVVTTIEAIAGGEQTRIVERRSIAVESAPGGLRVHVIETGQDPVDVVARIDPSGAVTVEDGAVIFGRSTFGPDDDVLGALVALVPELALHGRTLGQSETLLSGDDIAKAFALAPEGLSFDSDGAFRLVGESRADGRRVYVFQGDYTFRETAFDVTIEVDGFDAYAADTGLPVYASYALAFFEPQSGSAPYATAALEMICGFAGS